MLENLFDVQLVDTAGQDSTGNVRYRMHDLIRLFGRERAATEDTPGALAAARQRAFGQYLSIAEAANRAIFGGDFVAVHSSASRWDLGEDLLADITAAPLRWFEVERMNIATVVDRASADGEAAFCWDLAWSTSPLFTLGTYVEERAALIICALAAAQNAGDVRGEAAVRHRLGMLYADRKEFTSALREFERAVNLFVGVGDEHGRAIALAFIGMTKRFVNEHEKGHEKAIHFYTRAVTGFQRTGDVGGEAFALRGIGQAQWTRAIRQQPMRASSWHCSCTGQCPGPGSARRKFSSGAASCMRQARHPDAEPLFKEVLSIAREVGDRAGQAQAMRGIAICQHAQNDRASAAASLAEALQLLRRPTPAIVEGQIMATARELGYENVVPAG